MTVLVAICETDPINANAFLLLGVSTSSRSNSFAIMLSIKTISMTLIHLQFCAITLTAKLPIPTPAVLLNGPERPDATALQFSHTNLTDPFPTCPLVPPVNLGSNCLEFLGGFVIYDVQAMPLNLADVLYCFQNAIKDSRQHPGSSFVGMSKVYENDDVELLFHPGPVMTWRDLEGTADALIGYVVRMTNFSIVDYNWQPIGKGIVGLV